ncbi:MAG: amidase [Dehalococcoidia bacterium]
MTSTQTSIAEAGVRDIAAAVASGELTPSDVLEQVIERIEATEPGIQAWSQLDLDTARREAEALTVEAKNGSFRGPLHGVPVGVKEEFFVRGMTTMTWTEPEPEDATVVARLRAGGAIIVGKTTMPIDGVNPPTRNPWNLGHTAGGTSSGSGAVVGARVVPLAIGEQTAGSNLRPAAYCGVEGLKPTYGLIPRFGCSPFSWSRDHVGLIGLTMADMALVLSQVAGFDAKDPTSKHVEPPSADLEMAAYRPPTIGIVRNFFPERTEAPMLEAIERSADTLRDAGATVTDIVLPAEFSLAWSAASIVTAEGAAFNAERRAGQPIEATALRQRVVELVPATYYVQARRARNWLAGQVVALMQSAGVDALLMGVAPGAAPAGIESTGDASLLTPWSFLGFPAITVNGGLSPEGLPLGLQFVSTPMQDWELLRLGAWASDTLGRLPAPPMP